MARVTMLRNVPFLAGLSLNGRRLIQRSSLPFVAVVEAGQAGRSSADAAQIYGWFTPLTSVLAGCIMISEILTLE
jgi:hypothetical protein